MIETFGQLKDFSGFDYLFDGPIESEHHEFCPMAINEKSTLCECAHLYKADRDAASEERYERSLGK